MRWQCLHAAGGLGKSWYLQQEYKNVQSGEITACRSLSLDLTFPRACTRGMLHDPIALLHVHDYSRSTHMRASPSSCSLPQSLHFSQPTQSMADVMLWKWLCS